jgi:hypothetical protein
LSKVRVRLMSETKKDLEKLRRHMLKKHPQMIMSHPRMGSNPKYQSAQKWFCYGDYEFGKVRRRRGD